MKKYLLFGLIASVLSINAYAVSATVTSKDYVDTTRQATIPASGTNSATPGDTVVTYTSTAGTIGERGIFDFETGWDDDEDGIVEGHETDLLEADSIVPRLVRMDNTLDNLSDTVDNLPETTVTYKTCYEWSGTPHTDENCILWNLSDKSVYGAQCQGSGDCDCYENGHFAGQQSCVGGRCTGECRMH